MLIYAVRRQMSGVEFTHFLSSSNPPVCKNWEAGGGREGWSHFWQCQDFESGCYPNPALIRPLCGGVIWYEWTDHELTLTILFWPGTPCCFTSQFLSRSRPLREFHEAFYTDYVLISCLTFYSEQKRYIFKVTNKLTIVIWLWNKLELWSSPTTGTRPLTPGQK